MINATAVEAVIFDMDGVLIDSEVVYMNRLRWFVRDFLGKQVPEERLLTMVGATGNGHFEAVREYCPPDWDIEVFRSHYREYGGNQSALRLRGLYGVCVVRRYVPGEQAQPGNLSAMSGASETARGEMPGGGGLALWHRGRGPGGDSRCGPAGAEVPGGSEGRRLVHRQSGGASGASDGRSEIRESGIPQGSRFF